MNNEEEKKIIEEIKKISEIKSPERVRNLIIDSINVFNLDLKGLKILTEAASSYFSLTPVIAAVGGADKVYAVAKKSRYASIELVKKQTELIARFMGTEEKIEILDEKKDFAINEADIITNLGWVRPIDKEMVSKMKETAVVPLMREAWEFRDSDIDLKACKEKGIVVLGTNEKFRGLELFNYSGVLIAKQLFMEGIEIYKSKVLVIGSKSDGYSNEIIRWFRAAGAEVFDCIKTAKGVDAIIISTYPEKPKISEMDIKNLGKTSRGAVVLTVMGESLDVGAFKSAGFIFKNKNLREGYMDVTMAFVGPKPVIDLHTAGLKVGELMGRARLNGLTMEDAEKEALKNPLCQSLDVCRGVL